MRRRERLDKTAGRQIFRQRRALRQRYVPIGSRGRCERNIGSLYVKHSVDADRRADAESGSNRSKEPNDAQNRNEPAACTHNHAHKVGIHADQGAPDTLGDEEEPRPSSKQT
jgi:hypothetical protein